uniref:A4_EXTRA domain-containing protein n=1 Tax=Trichuris muris TaxID=70415 RepID=A0A5S6QS92_TRIMR
MTYCTVVLLALVAQLQSASGYTEVVSASVTGSLHTDGHPSATAFTPQVVFQCGFRNRYMTENGEWRSDPDARASCLTGKLDVLKYCRRVYRKLTITNIVESSHFIEIDNWCKIEGSPCKWSFWVKPYRCVVGDFVSDTLLVPKHCRFDHFNRDDLCKDFDYWNRTAVSRCQRNGPDHSVQSFAMLEPCGVDMFSGVEFVCCPGNRSRASSSDANIEHIRVQVKPETEDDEDDYDDDNDDVGQTDTARRTSATPKSKLDGVAKGAKPKGVPGKVPVKQKSQNVKPASAHAKTGDLLTNDEIDDDDDDDDEGEDDVTDETASEKTSTYLRVADPENEHEAYRNALDELTKQHRQKVSKVMKEWSELDNRYSKMKIKEPAYAEKFKEEMSLRFQKTVAALEEENAEERRQIEEVHQQRILANLNERKREALKEFYQLYSRNDSPQPRAVLRALKSYIRAEEKERLHLINHYRHLLRSRIADALSSEVDLLSKLLEIDRRIKATIELLNSHPHVDAKVKPALVDFFNVYRRENTPDMPESLPDGFLNADQYRDLMEVYRQQVAPAERSNTDDSPAKPLLKSPSPEKYELHKERANGPFEIPKRELFGTAHRSPEMTYSSFNKKQVASHEFAYKEQSLSTADAGPAGRSYVLYSIAAVSLVAAVICGVFFVRHRASHAGQGFIEVNACTPEECHVANMQITGYENPAYRYFEERS